MDNSMKFIEKLHEQLLAHSFSEIKGSNGEKISGIYIRMENPVLYILGVFDEQNQLKTGEILTSYTKQMAQEMEELRCTHLISLRILLAEAEAVADAPLFAEEQIHAVNWRYSLEEKKVFAAKGEPNRIFGIEKLLLAASKGELAQVPPMPAKNSKTPWVCIGISMLCILLLMETTLSGNGASTIRAFGISREGILSGQYYRFFTSMFLHSGVVHLVSNGVFLYYFGVKAEQLFGRGRFLGLYFISGFFSGMFSIVFHDVLAIGASGAIYGVLGAMLMLTKKYGPRYTGMNYATMLLLAVTSVGFGFLDMGVDNFAHIGGFIGGSLVFLCYNRLDRKKKQLST